MGVVGLALIVLILSIPISNNMVAKNTAKKIENVPLPEKTEYVERAYLAGKLVGNGNVMQYFGAILIKSELPLEELTKIAREEGIPAGTLTRWKKEAKENGIAAPTGNNSETWSTQDKFLIVVETASMNETELAEYARKKGLYVEQIKAWRDACMNANGGVAKQAAKAAHPERWKGRATRNWSNKTKVFLNPDKVLEETPVVLEEDARAS